MENVVFRSVNSCVSKACLGFGSMSRSLCFAFSTETVCWAPSLGNCSISYISNFGGSERRVKLSMKNLETIKTS